MKKAMILSIFLIGAGVSYYFFFLLPSQIEHKLVLECRKLGEKYGENHISPFCSEPEFYYNPKLKKCFYYYSCMTESSRRAFIIDLYTNKRDDGYMIGLRNLSQEEVDKRNEFEDKKRKLFNEK